MSRTGLKATGRYSSCEICGDTTGRCRTNGEVHLCMTYPEGDQANDRWHYVGPSKGEDPGLWGVYVPFDESRRRRDWRETYWEDREQDDLAADALRAALRKPRQPKSQPRSVLKPGYTETPTASIQQRAEAYGALFRGWSLHRGHQRNLSDRYGFPVDDGNADLFGTISVNSVVSFDWKHPFPGCSGVDHCASFRDGMALSITDEQGRILGVEQRLDNQADGTAPDGGRYRWLSRPDYCDLGIPEYDGENPLGMFAPVRQHMAVGSCVGNDLIGISEGRGMKPRITASRWGIPVIGGGGHAAATGSPIQLNRYLLLNPGSTVLLLVDAGGLVNHRVVSHIIRTTQFCRQRGHQVLIPWWDQNIAKHDPDPDETPQAVTGINEWEGIRSIAWEDGRSVRLWTPEELKLTTEA